VLERAWNSLETNQFGTNDFMDWQGRRRRAAARLQPRHRHSEMAGPTSSTAIRRARSGASRAARTDDAPTGKYWCPQRDDGPCRWAV
jgi:hypothetical protein